MARSHEAEMLDDPAQEPDRLERTLRDVDDVNRMLGGYRALRLHLADLRREPIPARILDVGTGSAGALLHLKAWAPSRWSFVGVEVSPRIAAVAARRAAEVEDVHVVRADGLRLPFSDGSFDAAVCTLTLHHFSDPDAVTLLREMARVSSRKVVVNDLERSRLHYLGALALAGTVWLRSPLTRHDGPLSVRRSFTSAELAALGRAADLGRPRVRRRMIFRLVLEGDATARDRRANLGEAVGHATRPGRGARREEPRG